MKPLRRALQNGPSPMPIRHSCRKLFKVFTAPTQRGRSIYYLLLLTDIHTNKGAKVGNTQEKEIYIYIRIRHSHSRTFAANRRQLTPWRSIIERNVAALPQPGELSAGASSKPRGLGEGSWHYWGSCALQSGRGRCTGGIYRSVRARYEPRPEFIAILISC